MKPPIPFFIANYMQKGFCFVLFGGGGGGGGGQKACKNAYVINGKHKSIMPE